MRPLEFGPWEAAFEPEYGARVTVLRYRGYDLLTSAPASFRAPDSDYGRYETRPVFGYDDCFPSVDPCCHSRWGDVADHGDLWWQSWDCAARPDGIACSVRGSLVPVTFKRSLLFEDTSLTWDFSVQNAADDPVPFLHVMHALMRLDEIKEVRLPDFEEVIDEDDEESIGCEHSGDVNDWLMAKPSGLALMLLVRSLARGACEVVYRNGMVLTMDFPGDLFPTLGIWWNNGGYPDEDGCRRRECAFEPIPGQWSSLSRSAEEGFVPSVSANSAMQWQVTWNMEG